MVFHVNSNTISQVTHVTPSTDQLPQSTVLDQDNPVMTSDGMIIVTEKSKKVQHPATRNALPADSKYQSNFENF